MLETLFNSEYSKMFYSTYFEEHLRTAAFEIVLETEKSWKLLIRDLTHKKGHKNQDFSTSVSETSENVYLFVFISWLVSFYTQYFFDVVRNKLQTISIYTRVNKKKIKCSRKEYVMWSCFKFWPMKKIFQKL